MSLTIESMNNEFSTILFTDLAKQKNKANLKSTNAVT